MCILFTKGMYYVEDASLVNLILISCKLQTTNSDEKHCLSVDMRVMFCPVVVEVP